MQCLPHFSVENRNVFFLKKVLTERRCGRNLSMSFMSMPSSSSNLFILKERNHQAHVNHPGSHSATHTQALGRRPHLTPLCLCVAGALPSLSRVSCGNGWSQASLAAHPNRHPYNREEETPSCTRSFNNGVPYSVWSTFIWILLTVSSSSTLHALGASFLRSHKCCVLSSVNVGSTCCTVAIATRHLSLSFFPVIRLMSCWGNNFIKAVESVRQNENLSVVPPAMMAPIRHAGLTDTYPWEVMVLAAHISVPRMSKETSRFPFWAV